MLINAYSSRKIVSFMAAITFSVLGSAVLSGCGGNGERVANTSPIDGNGVPSTPAFDGNGVVKVLATSDTASSATPFVISNTNASEGADPVFDGIGALSAGASSALLYYYPAQQRNEILDYLFKPNYGQANQILKVEIGGDANSTLGTEHAYNHGSVAGTASTTDNINNGYETWLISEAFKRNPNIKIWGHQWGVPKWVGGVCTDANAAYLAKWVKLVQAETGAKVAYLSPGWNETPCTTQATVQGTVGTGANGKDTYTDLTFPPVLSTELANNGLAGIQLIGFDGLSTARDSNTISNLPDSPKNNALYAIGTHYSNPQKLVWSASGSPSAEYTASVAAKKRGLKFWESEDFDFDSAVTGGHLTRQYNFRYLNDGATSIVNWAIVGATYSSYPYMLNSSKPQMSSFAMEPWSGHYSLLEAPFWSMAHTTQFTTLGWRFVTNASGRLPGGGSIVTYRSAGNVGTVGTKKTSASPASEDWSAVIETTDATSAQDITIQVSTGVSTGPVSVFTSSDVTKAYFKPVSTTILPDASGNIKLNVQPNAMVTLSTTSGQAKGTAVLNAPPSSEFPASYSDNFDSYTAGEGKIKYFQAADGAFEAATCGGSGHTGMCLQQVVPAVPVLWAAWGAKNLTPTILIGRPQGSDTTVKADVLLNDANSTTFGGIGGRVKAGDSGAAFAGYKFIIRGDGTWSIFTGEVADGTGAPVTVLASGRYNVSASTPSWHTLSLAFSGDTITPLIDGVSPMSDATPAAKAVTVPTDTAAPRVGQTGLVSSFSGVQFDNFSVNDAATDTR